MSDQNTLRTIEKLGHGLAEVRQRALIHLNTKLEHELVTLKDLNESPDFARRLMEWFNYPAPSNIKLILKLTLESTDICGETFVSLGGIDFYKALRPDLEPDDQRSVDFILNRLEMLAPFVSVAPSSTAADSGVADFKDLEHMTDRLGNCTSNDVKSAYFLGENRPLKSKKYPDWFKVTVLPWQTLTLNDRQVLLQTNSSLCSRNISVVSEYCRFLAEVIFQDFPAEVFLQRPAIMQSFVGFISTCGEPIHLENSLKSLFVYLDKFEDRLKQSELRDLKHTQSPGYPLGYEVNQGLDCWEHEPVELLRQNETAIPIILIEIAETISSLFKSINLENAVIVNRILVKITKIFASCVDFHLLPVDDELTKYVLGKIRSILEWITNSMMTYGQRTHASKEENDFKFYASLAQLLETILPNIAPISMIKLVAPASLEKALAMASFDNHLPNSKFYSDSLKVQYLTALDPDAGKAFSNLRNISDSLRSTQRLCNNGTNQFSKDEIETLLSNGLKSMKYHRCTIIIEKAIEYTSQYQLPDFLIELMTHSIQTIRENTFQHLKHFVDETILEISNSGNNQLSSRIEFLTLRPILETMIKISIHDQSHSVSLNCGKIIHILITSNILWSEKMSKQIQTVLYDNLAEFELIVSYSDKLATAVLEVIFSTARLDRERLKSCLRLLLNPRRELRSDVMGMSIALFHDIFGKAMNQIVDLFLIHSPIDFNEQRLMDKVFRVDSVERLAKLVKSDSIELQLKYSAYSQLAVITVDGELAKLFLQDVGEEMLKDQLVKFSDFKALTAEEKEATGSLCDILRQICQVDHDLRKSLAEDLPFIITLIKLVEHTALSSPQHRRVTGFLYLLVLSDVLTIAEKDGLITCPYIISSKLQLPFQVETVHEKTPTEDRQYKREDDILEQNEVAQRTLRLAWNNASSVHSSSKLQMTEQDQFYAQQMSLELDLEQIEYTISNAVDHYGFEKGLTKANILLQTYPRDFTMLYTSTSKLVKFLAKFYQTKPNQIKDEQLLIRILDFSYNMLSLVPDHSFRDFLIDQMGDLGCPLYDYISFHAQPSREEAVNRRKIVHSICQITLKTLTKETFNHVFISILKRLSGKANRHDEHFYDLPFIQLITKALLKLTSDTGQPTHIEIISNWFHLIPELRSIIKSFNNGSGESSQSYMGKSVITNCVLSILNIIRQVKHEKWESTLLDENSSLLWCLPLLKFRSEIVRVTVLGIFSSLADTSEGFVLLRDSFQSVLFDDLMTIALDYHECSLVRSMALDIIGKVLAFLTSGSMNVTGSVMTTLQLVEIIDRMNFYESMYHNLRNFSYNGTPEDPSIAPVTPIFVKSMNEFLLRMLQFSYQDTIINMNSFNFPQILIQIINPSLINLTDGLDRKYLIQQAATTAQILSYLNNKEVTDGFVFVASFYSVEFPLSLNGDTSGNDNDMNSMLFCANQYIQITLEGATEKSIQNKILTIMKDRFELFSGKMNYFLANHFWTQNQLCQSFLQTYITMLTKFSQLDMVDQIDISSDLLKTIISKLEELILKSEIGQVEYLRVLVGCAVQCHFACDRSAPIIGIKIGFLDRLVTELAKIQIKISIMKFRQLADTAQGRLLVIIFGILRNALHKQPEVKKHLASGEFVPILSRLWSYCATHENLTRPLLQLVLNFSHENQDASSKVAQTPLIGQIVKQFHTFNSQIKVKIKINSVYGLIFKVLDNLSISAEARAYFWKANMLGGFTKAADCGVHSNRSRQQLMALKLWLKLLIGISYHKDGQDQILGLKDILDYLCDLYEHLEDESEQILLLIHNLCYSPSNRIRMSQHNRILSCLKLALTPDEPIRKQQMAASACWSLMSSSQKAKGRLKAIGLREKLDIAIKLFEEEPEQIPIDHFKAALELITT